MEEIFKLVGNAVNGPTTLALAASLLWGMLSIVLSPCHLASIPLIVAFIDEQGRTNTRRAFYISSLFSLGILITIAVIGIITSSAGHMLGDLGVYANYFVAIIFFIVGLHFLGVIPNPLSGPGQVKFQKKGALAALILGLVFGIALGPCTFGFMAPILVVAFKTGGEDFWYGLLLLAFYGIGHCAVIVFAGTFTEIVQRYMNWNERSSGALVIKKICGILILAGGLYLLYKAP